MPLTRHFYNLDEVTAALSYCCREHKTTEALFWLFELIQSDEAELGAKVLVEVYLMRYGIKYLSWFSEIHDLMLAEALDTNKLLLLCYQLCRFDQQDSSLLSLIMINLKDMKQSFPPLRLHESGVGTGAADRRHPIEKYFINTLYARKIRGALWAAPRCSTDIVLQTATSIANSMPPVFQKVFYAAKDLNSWSGLTYCPLASMIMCFMIICIEPAHYGRLIEPVKLTQLPESYTISINEWILMEGRRARRIYTIPHEALYLNCRRGLIPYTEDTMKELRQLGSGAHKTYEVMHGCRFWENYWDAASADFEEAYDIVSEFTFRDDIPDEWSAADQLKSHGQGLNNPGEQLYWRRWFRNWMSANDPKYYLESFDYNIGSSIEEYNIDQTILRNGWSIIQHIGLIEQNIVHLAQTIPLCDPEELTVVPKEMGNFLGAFAKLKM